MKKRLLALMLVVAMVMGMSMTTFASDLEEGTTTTESVGEFAFDDATASDNKVVITKEYVVTNENTLFPTETFGFTEVAEGEPVRTSDLGDAAYDAEGELNSYAISVDDVTLEVSNETATKSFNINLPAYDAVGTYEYEFSEDAGTTAGTTYDSATYTVRVKVYQEYTDGNPSGLSATAIVLVDTAKDETINNTYDAGSLAVSKIVTGSMGDKDKNFTVTVTFTAPEDKVVKEDITYVGGSNNYEGVAVAKGEGWSGTKTVSIDLRHGDTVTFYNIPYDVTYTVVENDYTGDGYEAADYDDNAEGVIESASVSTTITNAKDRAIDTGIFTNNMPYILALVAIAAVAVVMFRRKREF